MILPTKHINFSESILGLAGVLLSFIMKKPYTVDGLWVEYSKINNTKEFPAYHDFDNLILAVNLLHLIGTVDVNNIGEIFRYETNSTKSK